MKPMPNRRETVGLHELDWSWAWPHGCSHKRCSCSKKAGGWVQDSKGIRFFSARKHGLVDAAVRDNPSDKTAVVALPGGIGTLDEVFEILALIQLERIGSKFPVPFILMNYDRFYSKLLDFMSECEERGVVARGEVESLWKVCDGNMEALQYLAEFYDIPHSS